MSVAKVSEISATSTKGFQDAIQEGIARTYLTPRDRPASGVAPVRLIDHLHEHPYRVGMEVVSRTRSSRR